MHDDWVQRLALLGIDLVKLEAHLGISEAALPLLRAAQGEPVKLSEDVHVLPRQLRPSILDDLGLVEALRSECASFSRRERVVVTYSPRGRVPTLPKDVALCIYRVAQEALRNVARHAVADEVWVTLAVTGPELLLCVRDSGVGFDPEAGHARPGLGLYSVEERVHLVGAELTVISAPGKGTTVAVRVPLARTDRQTNCTP
jgi:signal transduction histidine kinase